MSNLWNAMHLNDSGPSSKTLSPNLGDLSRMSWSTQNPPGQVMEFTAIPSSPPTMLHAKRKPTFAADETPVPSKKMITEDSMAAHLSNLHISGMDHNDVGSVPGTWRGESLKNYTVNMTQWDLERKLRTAQKITVCNEILELDRERDTILPEILLNRISKPCSALMLWQPPPALANLIDVQRSAEKKSNNDKESKQDPRPAETQEDMET